MSSQPRTTQDALSDYWNARLSGSPPAELRALEQLLDPALIAAINLVASRHVVREPDGAFSDRLHATLLGYGSNLVKSVMPPPEVVRQTAPLPNAWSIPSTRRWTFLPIAALLLAMAPIAAAGVATSEIEDLAALADQVVYVVPRSDSTGAGGIYLMEQDGAHPVLVAGGTDRPVKHPDWSPDGSTLAYADDIAGTIWSLTLGDEFPVKLIDCHSLRHFADYPAWSPDGTKLAFTKYGHEEAFDPFGTMPPSDSSIMIYDLATAEEIEIAHSKQPWLLDMPRWSPDGSHLIVTIDHYDDELFETGSSIATLSLSNRELRPLTDVASFASAPDWNPVTGEIVYSTESIAYAPYPSVAPDRWNLFTISQDGSLVTQITDVPSGWRLKQPIWTPKGDRLTATLMNEHGWFAAWVDPDTGAIEPMSHVSPQVQPRLQPNRWFR